ncbi:phage baseplate assembly protein V [Clostridium sp.]|uniref:phage baseplate assembly protein V n=1 Tax=Clostridium sp. TaxID=1506 RepID=UPI00261FEB90|nr:phage baseplate assembly protein V [Clostridium sp.]
MNEGTIRNLIRVGIVSSINETNGTVRVIFDDKDDMVSDELQLLNSEYNIPEVKEQVLCLFLPNGLQQGFCLGGFYSFINPPPIQNKNLYYKKFDDGTSIQYDKSTKQLTINSVNKVIINGNVQINGNLSASGTVSASNIKG